MIHMCRSASSFLFTIYIYNGDRTRRVYRTLVIEPCSKMFILLSVSLSGIYFVFSVLLLEIISFYLFRSLKRENHHHPARFSLLYFLFSFLFFLYHRFVHIYTLLGCPPISFFLPCCWCWCYSCPSTFIRRVRLLSLSLSRRRWRRMRTTKQTWTSFVSSSYSIYLFFIGFLSCIDDIYLVRVFFECLRVSVPGHCLVKMEGKKEKRWRKRREPLLCWREEEENIDDVSFNFPFSLQVFQFFFFFFLPYSLTKNSKPFSVSLFLFIFSLSPHSFVRCSVCACAGAVQVCAAAARTASRHPAHTVFSFVSFYYEKKCPPPLLFFFYKKSKKIFINNWCPVPLYNVRSYLKKNEEQNMTKFFIRKITTCLLCFILFHPVGGVVKHISLYTV